MTTLDTVITAQITSTLSSALDLATGVVPLDYKKKLTWTSGTTVDKADLIFHDQRTLGTSATEDLDLAGSLSSAYGSTLTFVELRALMIFASTGNTNNVNLTRPASNGVPLFLAASDGIPVGPGGMFLWFGPADGKITVTAATGDLITLTNSAGSTTVTYDVIIIGTSA